MAKLMARILAGVAGVMLVSGVLLVGAVQVLGPFIADNLS